MGITINIAVAARATLAMTMLLLATAPPVCAKELYRYVNERGNVVVGYQIPVEYIAGGYEVLNDEGMVLRVVPRELTEEEKAAWDVERRREEEAKAEAERLRAWDESLLLRYSSLEDIEAARDRNLRDLRIRLSILKGNRRSLKQQVENYQAQAAAQERRGKQVDETLLTAISELQSQIEAGDRSIMDREQEIEVVDARYQKDIDRFEKLLEVVELRRSMTSSTNTKK